MRKASVAVMNNCKRSKVCQILGIPRSTFYYRLNHSPKQGFTDEEEKAVIVKFRKHFGNFGRRVLHRELLKDGWNVSERQISKIMKKNELVSRYGRPKAKNIHTHPEQSERFVFDNIYWNLPENQRPTKVWSMDFTEQKVDGKKVYSCGIISINDAVLVGMKSGVRNNAESACDTLKEAINRFGVPDMILTDRGSPFVSKSFNETLKEYDIEHSMSRPHTPRDNRYIETFWKTMKTEIGQVMKFSIEEYLMVVGYYWHYYNHIRPHSRLNYTPPLVAVANKLLVQSPAASSL